MLSNPLLVFFRWTSSGHTDYCDLNTVTLFNTDDATSAKLNSDWMSYDRSVFLQLQKNNYPTIV